MEEKVIRELYGLKIFNIEKVLRIHTEILHTAYVIYNIQRTKRVTELHSLLRRKDIMSIGRYGNWEYASMEDAIIQGREAALNLKKQR